MTSALLPLCVDMDETLVLGDTFYRAILRLWRETPEKIPAFVAQLLEGGRPAAKAWLANIFPVQAASLPYRKELVDYLRAEKQKGRKLYLISASTQATVDEVARHTGLFDAAYGSDEKTNLKGSRKAAFIIQNISPHFAYAGDSFADLFVWNKAESAVLCGWKAWLLKPLLRGKVEALFPG
ncbi:MAG TPA: haloacid dehalogenase-like hydrolase [Alphaproteobacteria bacterium]|nr:haloacid dehalogenase-like hydrolase [Alphaproteobacteria bacterium]